MTTKKTGITAALVSALVAAVTALGLVATAPKVETEFPSTSPATRGFGVPCDTSQFVQAQFFALGEHPWHKGALLPLEAAQEAVRATTDFRPSTFSGSYACRLIRGSSSTWSLHSWAVAVDFDAAANCLGCPTEDTEIGHEPEFVRAFTRFGFVWGGTWSRPDAMHFEYDGPPIPVRPELVPGDRGAVVKALEALLAEVGLPRKADGVYEGKDLLGVIAFQKRNHILDLEHAVVGPATWTLLEIVTDA